MEQKQGTLKENAEILKMEEAVKEQMEKRQRELWRHAVPESQSLEDALNTMTKNELDDIRYNLCINGVSSLRKKELAAALVPEIEAFARKWMVTIGIEQYNILTHLSRKNGLSDVMDTEDMRFDYMRSMGIMFSGMADDKKAWYLPNEILKIYMELDNDKYRQAVSDNDEVSRVATGILYYYGFCNLEELHRRTEEVLTDKKMELVDFVGIMVNASCWNTNIVSAEDTMHYYTMLDLQAVMEAQEKQIDTDFKKFSYDEFYAAGEKDFVLVTDAYKKMISVLVDDFSVKPEDAADLTTEMAILMQNGEAFDAVFDYLQEYLQMDNRETARVAAEAIAAMMDETSQWKLKGYSPREIRSSVKQEFHMQTTKNNVVKFVPKSSKVGRNDPCPCGSGKKYKRCCLNKDI